MRKRRIEIGLTQPKLAAELGITFQNLYKYEKAKTRISAGRLYGLSKALGVSIAFFFEDIEAGLKTQKLKRPRKGDAT